MKNKKTVTDKKRAANRRNSKDSTGPRTKRGKNASKLNAVIDGIFAKDVVIPICDGSESSEDFEFLLNWLHLEFRPGSALEEFWVGQIAGCIWKLRRVNIAEKGIVEKAAGEKTLEIPDLFSDEAWLEQAHDEIKAKGTLSSPVLELVCATLEARHLDTAPDKIEASLKTCIEQKKEFSKLVSPLVIKQALADFGAADALPAEADMNRILRCQKSAQKKLDWALERLLEFRRMRQKAQAPGTA